MPSSRPESGQYIRQNSSDIPPPLIAAAYPTDDGPHARFNPNLGRNNRSNNVASSSNNRQLPSRPVNRSNTVRGAVKGTIREKGSTDQAYIPARSLTRGKTLTRPDRFVAPAPLIDPSNDRRKSGLVTTTMVDGIAKMQRRQSKLDFWGYFVYAITFYAPAWALSKCAGITDKQKQRAWKEKVALCSIALMMGTVIAFLTIGLTVVLCPVGTSTTSAFTSVGTTPGIF
jgi:chitin synthase